MAIYKRGQGFEHGTTATAAAAAAADDDDDDDDDDGLFVFSTTICLFTYFFQPLWSWYDNQHTHFMASGSALQELTESRRSLLPSGVLYRILQVDQKYYCKSACQEEGG